MECVGRVRIYWVWLKRELEMYMFDRYMKLPKNKRDILLKINYKEIEKKASIWPLYT